MSRPRLVVLISGNGSNLQALIDAVRDGHLPAEIVLVVSNRKDAYGLIRAQTASIPTHYAPLKPYTASGRGREAYDADLAAVVHAHQPDVIVCAGWMHVFTPVFLDAFPHRVINLHPALPGMFSGTEAIRRAFEAYQREDINMTGCMVHEVIPEVDAGAVIASMDVPIYEDDTLADLEARMHNAEHGLIVRAVRIVLEQISE